MKLNRRIFVTQVMIATIACGAIADPMPPSLKAAYKDVEKAIARLDFKAFAAHFDPSFVLIDPQGKSTTRAEFLAELKPIFEGFDSAKASAKIKNVYIVGEHAVVDYVLDLEIKGKPGTIKIQEVGMESLMRKNGKWLLYRTVQEKFTYSGP